MRSVRSLMEERRDDLARVRAGEGVLDRDELMNSLNQSGQQHVQLLSQRVAQVQQALGQAIDQIEQHDPRPADISMMQSLKTQVSAVEEKTKELQGILRENLAVLEKREKENCALERKLKQLTDLKGRPLPPTYAEVQLCDIGTKMGKQVNWGQNGRRN